MCWISNKVIWIQTNYIDNEDDFTKLRPYLIINSNQGIVELVPISTVKKKIQLSYALYEINNKIACLKKVSHLNLNRKVIININNLNLPQKKFSQHCKCCKNNIPCFEINEYKKFLLKFNNYQSNSKTKHSCKIANLTNNII